jgi:ABC-type uncharacterized transport system permease subunit
MAFFWKSLVYNLDSHRANPVNLLAGIVGVALNAVFLLLGVWAMLFAGKVQNQNLVPYFITLQAIVMFSWGFVNFFFGGLRSLPEYVTEGALEPMLATPRNPLLLAALSKSNAPSLGELGMGCCCLLFIGSKWGWEMAGGGLMAAGIATLGWMAVFILAGVISFFVLRGNQLGHLLIDTTLAMSWYPTGKIFSGMGRIALLLTPAAATAILPMEWVERLGWREFALALLAAITFFAFSIGLFQLGLKRYRAVSLIGARR